MDRLVTLLTDRPDFAQAWQASLGAHGIDVRVRVPDELAAALADGGGIVVDGRADAFDEDELLTVAASAKAGGLLCAVLDPRPDVGTDARDVLVEITAGLVGDGELDRARISRAMHRRFDRGRERKFEYVTLGTRPGELLVVLGDGRSLYARRPVSSDDDGSEVVGIELAADASSATLSLGSGAEAVISTADVVPTEIPSLNSVQSIAVDGAKLGRRLRALRMEAGLTQAELARRTGIHRPNIARVEAGRHTPSLETLARLASAIGVPTTRVLEGDG